jgi:hypothetical protein
MVILNADLSPKLPNEFFSVPIFNMYKTVSILSRIYCLKDLWLVFIIICFPFSSAQGQSSLFCSIEVRDGEWISGG